LTSSTLESLRLALTEARCHAAFHCPHFSADVDVTRSVYTSEADCELLLRRLPEHPRWSALRAAVAAGRIRYDEAAARRCVEREAASCIVNRRQGHVCHEAFVGTLPVGASCVRGEECAGSAWCDYNADGPNAAPCRGRCTPRGLPGSSCYFDRQCDPANSGEARCDAQSGDTMGTCVDVRWATFVPREGEPCGEFRTSDTLLSRTPCQAGLYCREGSCITTRALGESCSPGSPCAEGLSCLLTGNGEARACGRLVRRNRAGEPCGPETNSFGFCSEEFNLECVAGACRPAGDGTAGSRCLDNQFSQLAINGNCNAGLYCDRTSQTCLPRRAAEGDPCQQSGECLSLSCVCQAPCANLYCGPDTRACE
jgi:hypothetical protein